MQLHELQQQIVQKNLDNFYIFFGPEVGIMDIYLDKFPGNKIRVDSVSDAYSKINKKGMVKEERCFIVRDDKDYLKQEKVWDKIELGMAGKTDKLILIFTAMDKRSKFYKTFDKKMTEFEHLSADLLSKYIGGRLPGIAHPTAVRIADICECDYNRAMMECDKVKQYAESIGDTNYTSSAAMLLMTGVIYKPIGDITFQFTDSIALRQYDKVGMYLDQARRKSEPEIMVLSVLYNTFKHILMVQGLGTDQSDPCKRTGLTPWQVKLAKEKQGHYTLSELLNALVVIREAEKDVKTGRLDIDIALEYVILKIMYVGT